MNQQHPANLLVNDYSLRRTQKKTIGGLISSAVTGTFVHTNTIEEYNALDFNELVRRESQKVLQNDGFGTVNRFVVVTFGDLKNYLFHHR